MGKKLDALLGRTFKTYKFKALVNLALSRLAVLKNQRQIRCSQARSDVVQLLQIGHHERALLRVEHVIKEQNMLDVFVLMEGYCNLVVERVNLIEQDRVCPEELKEAIAGLLYGASRCGDFPELQEIRAVFTSRYGKEFAARAIELRNNCGVNPKMIQKLSTRQPSLENRMKVLKEIAAENNIILQLEASSVSTEERLEVNKKQDEPEPETSSKQGNNIQISKEEREKDEGFSDSIKTRKKYKDVADAAQAAFESAAYAAAAARAAVELSRSESHDPDDHNSPSRGQRNAADRFEHVKLESESKNGNTHIKGQFEEINQENDVKEFQSTMSTSSSDSADENVTVTLMSWDEVDPAKLLDKEIVFDESDNETYEIGTSTKNAKLKSEILESEKSCLVRDIDYNQLPSSSRAGFEAERGSGNIKAHATEGYGKTNSESLHINKGPISVRTRRVRGY